MFPKLILALCCLVGYTYAQGGGCPSGWTKWNDEKCYNLIQVYANLATARNECSVRNATLASVKEGEQQSFLNHFVYNVSGVDIGVWIGATRSSPTEFQWEDGSPVEYANWAVESPSNVTGRDCVAMMSRLSKSGRRIDEDGQWRDITCTSPNYFLCESIPVWTTDDILAALIETRRQQKNTAAKLENLLNNPVPVGFIYTQYPNQSEPQLIWPAVNWTEVTANYSGLFFRAQGGASAGFGAIQQGDSPKLTNVKSENITSLGYSRAVGLGSYSTPLFSGSKYSASASYPYYGITFLNSNVETRPTNTAIRVWVREE